MTERTLANDQESMAGAGQCGSTDNNASAPVTAKGRRKRLLIVAPHVVQYSSPYSDEWRIIPNWTFSFHTAACRGRKRVWTPGMA